MVTKESREFTLFGDSNILVLIVATVAKTLALPTPTAEVETC